MLQLFLRAIKRRLTGPKEVIEGYESPELIEVIFQKTKAFRPAIPWKEDAKTVLDFGGGCGLHYKAASFGLRWAVVETPAMVERASELATGSLQFFTNIRDAVDWLGNVDLMHSNGALQYTADPNAYLEELCSLNAKTMLWKRIKLSGDRAEIELEPSLLLDSGPGSLRDRKDKIVKLQLTRLPESVFLAHHEGYTLTHREQEDFRFVRTT